MQVGAESDLERRPAIDVLEPGLEASGQGTAVAAILVAGAALLLALLPAAVALEVLSRVGWIAEAVGSFIGFIFSLKLGAIAWGVAAQLWSTYHVGVVADNADETLVV